VYDAVQGTLLDSRSIAGFTQGQYLVWEITGHIQIRLRFTGSVNPDVVNALASGLFFDSP